MALLYSLKRKANGKQNTAPTCLAGESVDSLQALSSMKQITRPVKTVIAAIVSHISRVKGLMNQKTPFNP